MPGPAEGSGAQCGARYDEAMEMNAVEVEARISRMILAQLFELARSHQVTEIEQRVLVKHPVAWVQGYLAQNPALSPEVQEALSKHPEAWVQGCLAQNPALLPELQQVLVSHPDVEVQRWLAGNQAVLLEVQRVLVRHPDEWVVKNMAPEPVTEPGGCTVVAGSSRSASGCGSAEALEIP